MSASYLSFLQEYYGADVCAISRAQFRAFLNISPSTDCRLFAAGQYPRCIAGQRILLPDLAAWLASDEARLITTPLLEGKRKRGRPVGSKTKKEQEA